MKKKFKLTNLDCANCAAKMENAIKKIDGVRDANVSFMTQKRRLKRMTAVLMRLWRKCSLYAEK